MDANQVIDAYVRDVAAQLPRRRRNDVAFELRALLQDELAAVAKAENREPDRAMAMALLKRFGRPTVAAGRYGEQQPAIIDPIDTHHFLIWTVVAAVLATAHALANGVAGGGGDLFLEGLGVLVLVFATMGWWRRRHTDAFGWKPNPGRDAMPRGLALLACGATLVFPFFMYAAPASFVRVFSLGALDGRGLALAGDFAGSGLRVATLALLGALVVVYAAIAVQGGWRRWTRRIGIGAGAGLGMLCLAHAGETLRIFDSATANEVAKPTFIAVALLLLLGAAYDGYREWARIQPAPEIGG